MQLSRSEFLGVIVASTVLLPWIPVAPGLPQLRFEWFLLFAGMFLLNYKRQALAGVVVFLGGAVIFFNILSIANATFLDLSVPAFADLFELLKPILYVCMFIQVASGKYTIQELESLLRVAILSLFASCAITVIQYLSPDLIAPILYLYRPDPEELENYRGFRAWGTMGNPNDQGFVAAIAFGLMLFTFRFRIFPYIFSVLFLAVGFVAVFATGSRTAIVAMTAILSYFFVAEMKKNIASIMFSFAVISFVIWIFYEYLYSLAFLAGTVDRIVSLGAIAEDEGGWVARVRAAQRALDLVSIKPLLGYGPSKSTYSEMSNVDNEYVLLLFRFGIVGLLVTLAFVLALATRLKRVRYTGLKTFRNLNFALLGAASLYAYTAGIYGQFRIMFLLIILWVFPSKVLITRKS